VPLVLIDWPGALAWARSRRAAARPVGADAGAAA
jgi:hypothetical protein